MLQLPAQTPKTLRRGQAAVIRHPKPGSDELTDLPVTVGRIYNHEWIPGIRDYAGQVRGSDGGWIYTVYFCESDIVR